MRISLLSLVLPALLACGPAVPDGSGGGGGAGSAQEPQLMQWWCDSDADCHGNSCLVEAVGLVGHCEQQDVPAGYRITLTCANGLTVSEQILAPSYAVVSQIEAPDGGVDDGRCAGR